MNNELIYRALVEMCCGDSDMVLKVKDNSVKDGYLREAEKFEEWLSANSHIPMCTGWERTDYDGFVIFSDNQDHIYICRAGIDPSAYVEMEIIIYGD